MVTGDFNFDSGEREERTRGQFRDEAARRDAHAAHVFSGVLRTVCRCFRAAGDGFDVGDLSLKYVDCAGRGILAKTDGLALQLSSHASRTGTRKAADLAKPRR